MAVRGAPAIGAAGAYGVALAAAQAAQSSGSAAADAAAAAKAALDAARCVLLPPPLRGRCRHLRARCVLAQAAPPPPLLPACARAH